jgi:catechol 2,3-dioxygenase-like lactoylglutathione lyase family enzyme
MQLGGVLESCLYVDDLEAAARFYRDVLGLELVQHDEHRQVFVRCGETMLLIFEPERTSTKQSYVGGAAVPMHGTHGVGHIAFRANTRAELDAWRERVASHGVEIESEVEWPRGGRSFYFRDPAGNSLEIAMPSIWGMGVNA